jgi:hypothetical protein
MDALYVAASGLQSASRLLDTAASNIAGRLAHLPPARVLASSDPGGGVRTQVVPAPGGDLLDDLIAASEARRLTGIEAAYLRRTADIGRWVDRLG